MNFIPSIESSNETFLPEEDYSTEEFMDFGLCTTIPGSRIVQELYSSYNIPSFKFSFV